MSGPNETRVTQADRKRRALLAMAHPDAFQAGYDTAQSDLLAALREARGQVEADLATFRDVDFIYDPIGAAAQMEAALRNCQATLATIDAALAKHGEG